MSYRNRDAAGTFAGIVVFAVIAAAVAFLVLMVPVVLRLIAVLGRFQGLLLERVVAGVGTVTGWQFDGEAMAVRLVAAAALYAGTAMLLFFLVLVGSNLGTMILLAVGSATTGMLLTLSAALGDEPRGDHLSSLRFWD